MSKRSRLEPFPSGNAVDRKRLTAFSYRNEPKNKNNLSPESSFDVRKNKKKKDKNKNIKHKNLAVRRGQFHRNAKSNFLFFLGLYLYISLCFFFYFTPCR